MTTINDISDLAQVLQDNPQWREIVRGILLGDELLQLPSQVAEFVQAVNRSFETVNQRLERLEAGQERLENDVAGLKAGQERLENDVAGLKAGQERLENDVAGLEAGQERLEAGQERLENDVAGLKVGQERLEAGQERLENDVAGLKVGQERLETTQSNMAGRLANVVGSDYERQAARVAGRRLHRHMGLEAVQVVVAWNSGANELTPLVDAAVYQGAITEDQADDIAWSDLVLRGLTPEGETRYVVVETSVRVERDDIARARRRADVLARVVASPVLAAVIGGSASPEDLEFAANSNTAFLQVEPPR